MAKHKRALLVVVDPTASAHPSIERAAWLARHEPAHIELFISDYASPAGTADEARQAVIERHRRRLELLAEPLRAEKLAVSVDVRWDYPLHDSIVRKAQDAGADLVIKDTHYHSALEALDILEHRLELDPQLRQHAVARQAAAAGAETVFRRGGGSAPRA